MNKLSLHTALIALALGTFSASAQTMDDVKDTLRVGNFRAHDHLLQKPLGFLQYEDGPQTLQHFFWSLGGGAGITGTRSRQAFTGQFTLGSWITPVYGWRLHGGINSAAVPNRSRALAFTAGADMLINLSHLNYDRGYNPYRKFELIYTLGLGAQNYPASSLGTREDNLRYGVNTSLQARYFINRPLYVFVEPQFSMMYGQSANGLDKKMVRPVFSPTANVNVGFGYQLLYGKESINWRNDPFERHGDSHMFFGAGGGLNARLSNRENQPRLTTMAFVGKMLSPISGLRLNMTMNQVRTYENPVFHVYQNRYTWTTGLDYIYALNSAFGPYDDNSRINLNLLVGPTMTFASAIGSRIDNPDNVKVYPGAEVGVNLSMRILPNWYFYVEPMVQFFTNDYSVDVMRFSNNAPSLMVNTGLQYNVGNFAFDYNKAYAEYSDENNWQIYLAGGPSWRHFYRTQGYGTSGLLGLQRRLSPVSAVRLAFDGTVLPQNRIQMGGQLSYLFDMTTSAFGYDPNRLFTFSAVMGLNAGNSVYNNQTSFHMGAHAGFQTNFQLTKTLGAFVEPQLLISRVGIEYANRLDPGYRILAGLHYTMQRNQGSASLEQGSKEADKIEYPWTLALGGGINSRLSSTMDWRQMGSLSAAYTFNKYAGLRLGLQYMQTHDARQYPSGLFLKQYLISPNIDFLLNLNTLLVGYNPETILQPKLVVGGLAAFTTATHKSHSLAYPGIEAGLNLGVRLSDQWGLYVEPMAQFFGNTFTREVYARTANQPNLTISGGVTYSMATPKRVPTSIDELEHKALNKDKKVSTNPLFISAGGGFNTRMQSNPAFGIRQMASIAAGCYLGNYSAIRLGMQYHKTRDYLRWPEMTQHQQELYTANLDYLLNAKKLFCDEDVLPNIEANVVLGGVLTKSTQTGTGIYPGLECGLNLGYDITKHISLYAEPMFQFYTTKMNNEVARFQDNVPFMSLSAGVAYKFAPSIKPAAKKVTPIEQLEQRNQQKATERHSASAATPYLGVKPEWFASLGGGINTRLQYHPAYGIRHMLSTAVGCAMTDYSTLRLGLQYQKTRKYLEWPEMVIHRQGLFSLNLDYLFNVKNLIAGSDVLKSFDANVVAGGLLAMSTQNEAKFYPGLECGLNLGYNFTKQFSIYAEPMFQFYTTKMNNEVARYQSNIPFMTLSAGIAYKFADSHKAAARKLEQLEQHNQQKASEQHSALTSALSNIDLGYSFDWKPEWFASVGGGINTRMQYNPTFGVNPVRPMASIALGCSMTNYSALRLSFQYQKTRNYLEWPEMISHRQGLFTLNLDYLCNVKNLILGQNRLKGFNANLIAGGILASSTQNETELYPGWECGFNLGYDINKRLSVYAEPMFQFYSTEMNNKVARFQDNVTFMTVSAGVSYKF